LGASRLSIAVGEKMKFHLEGLKKKQFEILKKMGPFMRERGFYLAGGTALSLYFGHRISVEMKRAIQTWVSDLSQ
jgi:hypothetical protein